MLVVFLNQQTGGAYAVHLLKSSFSAFSSFSAKTKKKEKKVRVASSMSSCVGSFSLLAKFEVGETMEHWVEHSKLSTLQPAIVFLLAKSV